MQPCEIKQFSVLLKAARKASKFSQDGLASKVGVTGQAYREWEWGNKLPSRENLTALVRLLGDNAQSMIELLWGRKVAVIPEQKELVLQTVLEEAYASQQAGAGKESG